jgi:hypothetical protein
MDLRNADHRDSRHHRPADPDRRVALVSEHPGRCLGANLTGWNCGWGPKLDAAPYIDIRFNLFLLLHGSLAALPPLNAETIAGPSYWWPSDRSWVVGTDLDDFCTYIAGSHACITALLAETRAECYRTSADTLSARSPTCRPDDTRRATQRRRA